MRRCAIIGSGMENGEGEKERKKERVFALKIITKVRNSTNFDSFVFIVSKIL
jgi:hypothetical protein